MSDVPTRQPGPQSQQPEQRVLLLAPTTRDAAITVSILAGSRIACTTCAGVSAMCSEIQAGAGALLLTEEILASAQTRTLAALLRNQPPWSDLPVVVLVSGGANSPAGLRAMQLLGSVTILERPVQTATLVSVLGTLLRARQRQYQLREHLLERERLLASERAARNEAERAGRTKDEFLATLSHELRTPLNAILGWSQILQGGNATGEDLEQGLETIGRNARAQAQIIEDLLDMSRIISGKVRLNVQRVELANVVEAALDTVRPAAEAKGVRLQPVLDRAAGVVSGDPNRLQQVFWNLLSNAIKFTPRGGRVQVVLEQVDSHVEVSVNDSGEGIRPEFLPHVFDRFRQADASTTRRHGGLGLGLSIVRHLLELHGGSIEARSDGVGRGATFVVSLPVTVLQGPATAGAARHYPSPAPVDTCAHAAVGAGWDVVSLEGVRVLVVDDEADARALVKRLLEDCQASVATASSAAEALAAIAAAPPDVLISDIGMPGEDGYALIQRIRALPKDRGGDLPAVALTAYARSEDRTRAILSGYQTHVSKPVEPAELVATVASLAGRTAAGQGA
jgi:signal transduction histidine kinase/ActR/RegA family two-component response regulator